MKKQYDHYKVLHTIASSPIVSFHVAKDTNTDEDVFLRVLAHSEESAQTKWFTTYDDYQLTIMNYKHLPRVTAINQSHDNDVYTVFPYITGKSLAATGTLSVTQFERVIEAVSHLHQKGFIHGKISPDNIWITEDEKVLLFGTGEWIVTKAKADKQSDIQDMIELGSTYCGLDFRGSDEIKTVKDLIPFLTQPTKPGLVEKKVIQKPIEKKEKISVPEVVEKQDKKPGIPLFGKKRPIVILFSALLLILLTSILIDKSSTSESTLVDSEEIVSSATEVKNTDSEPVKEPEPELTFEEIKVAFKEELYSKNNKDDSFTIHELDMTEQNRPEIVGISGSDLVNIEIYQFDEAEKAFTLTFSKEEIPVTRTIIEEFAEGKEQIIFANNTTDSSTQLLAIGAVDNKIEVVLDQEISSSFGVTFDKEKKNLLVEVKDEEETKYLWDGMEYTEVPNEESDEESVTADAPKKAQTSDTKVSNIERSKDTTSSSSSSVENGYGEEFYDDGGYYKGNYRNGLFHGKGVYAWPDGTKYEGDFVDGYFHGYGVMTYNDGTRYEGQFKNDYQTGKGKLYWSDGSKYEGEVVDGLQSGYGTQIYSDGSRYVGDFVDGWEHGRGKYTWPDGSWYEGEYRDGWPNGKGTMVWEDGTKFVGVFKDGLANGKGTMVWDDGTKFVGVFKDGAPTDEGTWTYP